MLYIVFSLLLSFGLYLAYRKGGPNEFIAVFAVMALFIGIQNGVGEDFFRYQERFDQYNIDNNNVTVSFFSTSDDSVEPGWYALNRLFGFFGFHSMVFIISCLYMYAFALLIRRFVDPNWWWLPFIVLTFNPDFLPFMMSGIRQGTALAIMIIAFLLMLDRKFWPSIILFLISTTIHRSAIFSAPVLASIAYFPLKIESSKTAITIAAVGIASSILLFVFESDVRLLLFDYVIGSDSDMSRYEFYARNTELTNVGIHIRLIYIYIITILSLDIIDYTEEETKVALLAIFSFIFIPVAFGNNLTRIILYEQIFLLACIHKVVSSKRVPYIANYGVVLIILFYYIRTFVLYLDGYGKYFRSYPTILDLL